MARARSKEEIRAAKADLKRARSKLSAQADRDLRQHRARGGRGGAPESRTFLDLNDKVAAAERRLPWWAR